MRYRDEDGEWIPATPAQQRWFWALTLIGTALFFALLYVLCWGLGWA